jgi:RNA polymerase sigma-70 factor (ECF subfamily)
MTIGSTLERARIEGWTDEEIVQRVLGGEPALFEILMRRHNQRVYRAIRSILREDAESEDVMQEAYVRAYEHLAQFEGRAQFSTWLTRIAVHEALKRLAARGKFDPLDADGYEGEEGSMASFQANSLSPEADASRGELSGLLEDAILLLPQIYRSVIVLRDVEEMSTAETAEVLSLTEANVKVRLHRGHELLRGELLRRVGASSAQAFGFHASRCDRVVQGVFRRLNLGEAGRTAKNPASGAGRESA